MAEFALKIKRDSIPDPAFQDGDIICALNDRRIKDVHAQIICHPRDTGFNKDGLRPSGSLLDTYLRKVMQYKFQRVSHTEIKRIILATLDEEILSDTPNAENERIDVPLFVARRLKSDHHQVFGATDKEYWYGGRTDASLTKLSDVWEEIEAKTAHREVDYTQWPFTEGELKNYLCISVDDFDNATGGDLVGPVTDDKDPDNPVIIKKRKNKIVWRDLPGLSLSSQADVLDKGAKVDIRETTTFTRSQIVEVKS